MDAYRLQEGIFAYAGSHGLLWARRAEGIVLDLFQEADETADKMFSGKEQGMINESTVLKKNTNIVTRTIEEDTMLMPIYRSSQEANCIYTLNPVGARVWSLIDGKRTLGAIKKKLLGEFDTTEKELDKELSVFLRDLESIKAFR